MEIDMLKLQNKINSLDNKYKALGEKWFSPNHILEIYLYEYFINSDKYNLCNERIHEMYRRLGDIYVKKDMKSDAEKAYLKALEYNSVDIDTYYALCNYYVNEEMLDKLLDIASKLYNFCYTRLDLSNYYYYLGQYFKLGFEPMIAYYLFSYSSIIFKTNSNQIQLNFMRKVLINKTQDYSKEALEKILSENRIPIKPNSVTLAIIYKAAKIQMINGNKEAAKQLYSLLEQF